MDKEGTILVCVAMVFNTAQAVCFELFTDRIVILVSIAGSRFLQQCGAPWTTAFKNRLDCRWRQWWGQLVCLMVHPVKPLGSGMHLTHSAVKKSHKIDRRDVIRPCASAISVCHVSGKVTNDWIYGIVSCSGRAFAASPTPLSSFQ